MHWKHNGFSHGSSLHLINCQLSNLTSVAHIIDIQAGRAFQAFSLYVTNITAATFLSVTRTNVIVVNSEFSEILGEVFASTESAMLSIHYSSLSNVIANGTGLISCSRVSVIELRNVSVTITRTDQMGIYFEMSDTWIEKCTFQAILGGKHAQPSYCNSTYCYDVCIANTLLFAFGLHGTRSIKRESDYSISTSRENSSSNVATMQTDWMQSAYLQTTF